MYHTVVLWMVYLVCGVPSVPLVCVINLCLQLRSPNRDDPTTLT